MSALYLFAAFITLITAAVLVLVGMLAHLYWDDIKDRKRRKAEDNHLKSIRDNPAELMKECARLNIPTDDLIKPNRTVH